MQPEQNIDLHQPQPDRFDPTGEIDTSAPESPVLENATSWQASEFIHYEKSGLWFLSVLGVTTVLVLIGIFLIQSWTFVALLIVMALTIIVIARRPPRMITYVLSPTSITVDQKSFNLHDFKYFGVVQEGAFYSVRLVPHKRFMPMVSVFLPADQAEHIVDILGSSLPMEHVEQDAIDRFVERIRF